MFKAVREASPEWVVSENVLGLTTWNGGVVFEQVCADLESEGYQVQAFIIPACAINAGHKRNRIWIIAHSAERRLEGRHGIDQKRHRKTQDGSVPALVEDCNWDSFARTFVPGKVHGLPGRVDRIAALGNAIVPQVALQIFKAIEQFNNTITD